MADLVSVDAHRMDELVDGNLAVFCQIPQEARTRAGRRALAHRLPPWRSICTALDEAVLVSADPALKLARDQGRKSRITS